MSGSGQAASAALRPSAVVTSPVTAVTLTPSARISSAVRSSVSRVRDMMVMSTPSRASAVAAALPSPRLAPVSNALRPRMPRSMRFPITQARCCEVGRRPLRSCGRACCQPRETWLECWLRKIARRETPMTRSCTLALIALACALPVAAQAEELVVSNYGVTTNGMPFAVAMAKGFFKQQGADVTGILTSDGGGTTVRTMLGGNLAYGEINPTATVIAIQQGADLKIVSDNVQTVAEFVWAVKPDSPIKTAADLKGKKIGYTNPRSTSQALAILVLEKAGLKPSEAELVKTGGFGEGIVALDLGAVDVAPIPEPLWSQHQAKYRAGGGASDLLPPLDNVVGVTTGKAAAARGDFIRAVIRARRQAVDFMYANPDESADIIAKVYNLSTDVARSAVRNLLGSHDKSGVRYWSAGEINLKAMNEMMRAQKIVGALKDDPDWAKIIDESFLPDDLKRKTQ